MLLGDVFHSPLLATTLFYLVVCASFDFNLPLVFIIYSHHLLCILHPYSC